MLVHSFSNVIHGYILKKFLSSLGQLCCSEAMNSLLTLVSYVKPEFIFYTNFLINSWGRLTIWVFVWKDSIYSSSALSCSVHHGQCLVPTEGANLVNSQNLWVPCSWFLNAPTLGLRTDNVFFLCTFSDFVHPVSLAPIATKISFTFSNYLPLYLVL